MHISEFDYKLPKELIAQFPCDKREGSKMLVLNKTAHSIDHKHFFDITDFLTENDVLIMNNTRVIPARLIGKKETGAVIEVFLLKNTEKKLWEVLIKPSKRVKPGMTIKVSEELSVNALERRESGKWLAELNYEGNIHEVLATAGNIPLPPYIERSLSDEQIKSLDHERYQTVYAQKPGSVAAPTAGLHFSDEVLKKLQNKGIQIGYVNLNVGLGTFRPVECENILDHKMDTESYEIPQETADLINTAKKEGKNIVAVGTTTVRTLESTFKKDGKISATQGNSELFIYPGFNFGVIDKLITNFHLPKSTLLMLVSALAGRDFVFEAYKQAIEKNYRFYSYGDCMLIL